MTFGSSEFKYLRAYNNCFTIPFAYFSYKHPYFFRYLDNYGPSQNSKTKLIHDYVASIN